MATAAQTLANRANARLSSGPRSVEGKARSSQNNLRHGFRSQSVLLPGDDPAEYQALLDELTAEFDPRNLTERRCLHEMADAEWRLRRVRAHQQVILTRKIEELAALHPDEDPIFLQALAFDELHRTTCFGQFLRYESKFERQYAQAHRALVSERDRRRREDSSHVRAHLDSVVTGPTPLPRVPDEPNLVGRNAPCPCGSGQKFKRCCGDTSAPTGTPRSLTATR